jgi:amidohydrolase
MTAHIRLSALAVGLALMCAPAAAEENASPVGLPPAFERAVEAALPHLIAWRRDIHEHPELGNQETRTARLVAEHLRRLRFNEVRTGVARTGVVGVLRGGRPGPVIALRADMDALPVTEEVDLPFASRARALFQGKEVGVMHACGHDTHTAIAMALAEILAGQRAQLAGTVLFLFQPDEEGGTVAGSSGAKLMLEQGVFEEFRPAAVYGLHTSAKEGGYIYAAPGPVMASSDPLRIVVRGRQTHGAMPDRGIDPVVVSAQIITGLQTIASRQINAVNAPVIVTIGAINGGVRGNIIPDEVVMQGTIRSLNPDVREDLHARIRRTAEQIAASAGATAEVEITQYAPALVNDPALAERGMAAMRRALGEDRVRRAEPWMASEDFAYFARAVPGFYFNYGVNAPGVTDAAANHSPRFFVHEPTMEIALRAMLAVLLDRLSGDAPAPSQS